MARAFSWNKKIPVFLHFKGGWAGGRAEGFSQVFGDQPVFLKVKFPLRLARALDEIEPELWTFTSPKSSRDPVLSANT